MLRATTGVTKMDIFNIGPIMIVAGWKLQSFSWKDRPNANVIFCLTFLLVPVRNLREIRIEILFLYALVFDYEVMKMSYTKCMIAIRSMADGAQLPTADGVEEEEEAIGVLTL